MTSRNRTVEARNLQKNRKKNEIFNFAKKWEESEKHLRRENRLNLQQKAVFRVPADRSTTQSNGIPTSRRPKWGRQRAKKRAKNRYRPVIGASDQSFGQKLVWNAN